MFGLRIVCAAASWRDTVQGRIVTRLANAPVVLPHIRAGKLRALATTSAQRLSILSDFATIAESGLPAYAGMSESGKVLRRANALSNTSLA